MSNNIGWQYWLSFGLALSGALAWTPQVYSLLQKNEINGKILSNCNNLGTIPNTVNSQIIYIQKVALFSKNKDYFPKDFKVFIKYPSVIDELECTIWTWTDLVFTFNENGNNVQKKLNINLNDYLIQEIVFPKNETIVGYASFSVDYDKDEMFEYLRYEFTDYNGKEKKLTFTQNEIEANKLIHEDNIWIN